MSRGSEACLIVLYLSDCVKSLGTANPNPLSHDISKDFLSAMSFSIEF